MSLCSIGRRESSDSAELFETPFGLVDGGYPVLRFAEALFQGLFEWGEPWVEFDYSCATVSPRLASLGQVEAHQSHREAQQAARS